MTDAIAATQQGVISTQLEQVQRTTIASAPPPQEVVEAPSPPPPDSGRGASVDVVA